MATISRGTPFNAYCDCQYFRVDILIFAESSQILNSKEFNYCVLNTCLLFDISNNIFALQYFWWIFATIVIQAKINTAQI